MKDDEPIGTPRRTFFLGLRISEEQALGEDAMGDWSGTVYDQMVPDVNSRFRGLEKLSESVLEVVARLRRGDRGRIPPRGGAPRRRPSGS